MKKSEIMSYAESILGEVLGTITFGIVPDEGHEIESVCMDCGQLVSKMVTEGQINIIEGVKICEVLCHIIGKGAEEMEEEEEESTTRETNRMRIVNAVCSARSCCSEISTKLVDEIVSEIMDCPDELVEDDPMLYIAECINKFSVKLMLHKAKNNETEIAFYNHLIDELTQVRHVLQCEADDKYLLGRMN